MTALRRAVIVLLPLYLAGCSSVEASGAESDGFAAFEGGALAQPQSVNEESWPEEQLPGDILEPEVFGPASADIQTWHRERTDHWYRMSMCMEGRGWPAPTVVNPYTPHVALELDGWWGSRDQYVSDVKDCLTEAGPYPMPPAFTRELALKEYERAVAAHSCLIDLGAPLPEFPSQQKYVDDFVVNKSPWSPLEHLTPDDYPQDMTLEQLYERCPW
ncbi:hypothetical protein [Schaalia sp. Marseille-Q2122]|uniref:hypothetical protein n=1 Tax=Schaalia sp. Marseille-Q2122 TaxID=2736604 RepID=UPI00158959CC|nr:hypothetical protein [Schaalia sp. Marseille-Q2122]